MKPASAANAACTAAAADAPAWYSRPQLVVGGNGHAADGRGGKRDGVGHLKRRQLKQPSGRDRAAEHRRHRAVKSSLHTSRRQRFVDAPCDLVTDDHRGQDVGAADLPLFPERKRNRRHDRADMSDAAQVAVVAGRSVAGDCIDACRGAGRQLRAVEPHRGSRHTARSRSSSRMMRAEGILNPIAALATVLARLIFALSNAKSGISSALAAVANSAKRTARLSFLIMPAPAAKDIREERQLIHGSLPMRFRESGHFQTARDHLPELLTTLARRPMNHCIRTGFPVLLLALGANDAGAHHSTAVFTMDKVVELRGVVVDFKLRSPHSSFVIDARTFADGQQGASVERWEIESEALPVLRTMGIDANTFKPGDAVRIMASPHRDASFKFAHAQVLVAADGKEYGFASTNRVFSPSLRECSAAAPRKRPLRLRLHRAPSACNAWRAAGKHRCRSWPRTASRRCRSTRPDSQRDARTTAKRHRRTRASR